MAILHLFVVIIMPSLALSSSCERGFISDGQCINCPVHCLVCDSAEMCLSCVDGYWGNICELPCSRCQPGTTCEKTNGFCLDKCKNGYSGILCDAFCDKKCLSCERMNAGECEKCPQGWYGSKCDQPCSKFCYMTCNDTGYCSLGCKSGHWGPMCQQNCTKYCQGDSCDQNNGTCADGCKDGYTGSNCTTRKQNRDGNKEEKKDDESFLGKEIDERQDGKKEIGGRNVNAQGNYPGHWTVILSVVGAVAFVTFVVALVGRTLCKRQRKQDIEESQASQPLQSADMSSLYQIKAPEEPYEDTKEEPLKKTQHQTTRTATEDFGITNQETQPASRSDVPDYASHITVVPPGLLNIRFVKDFSGTVAYITCKDPINDSKEDLEFWELVWQQNCCIIVKLSRNVEETPEYKYWPEKEETKTCGPFTVTHLGETLLDECRLRKLELETLTDKRTVTQMQFKNWVRDRLPPDKESLLEFRQKVVNSGRAEGPTLVHCSDGRSRSYVYVALDMLLEDLEEERCTEMDNLLDKMKKQVLITTDEQCGFLRKTREAWKTFNLKQKQAEVLKTPMQIN